MKLLISGGGTGGHVFPAIAIANAVRKIEPQTDILFVGAEGKLEMKKVPEAGYPIIGLPIRGFQRKLGMDTVKGVFRLIRSLWKSVGIIRSFKPDVVVGVGGYASGPVLALAVCFGKPILIQEQNSYPGITNRMLSRVADKICVAFEGLEKYFDRAKMVLTGNPVRQDLCTGLDAGEARRQLGLDPSKKTIAVLGGSLGARSINNALLGISDVIRTRPDLQWIWQTGNLYYEEMKSHSIGQWPHLKMMPFVDRMDLVYSASDIVVSRAGALTLAELAVAGLPSILVPSPNVAEDHQRKNAEAFRNQGGARMILDAELANRIWPEIRDLLEKDRERLDMKNALLRMARPEAAAHIAKTVIELSH
ncbi:MAG TPA: undecaprenyldiphospho-muramoylpentapeptide beta-N-acetylglucosaminyltransferase [Saprospiraceae bacterium]|nr:undecaprenyldiphospho-muramoylpentapeptide beta-N-acetylglucosaminyltransferase [Saprospiraceae bacterium]